MHVTFKKFFLRYTYKLHQKSNYTFTKVFLNLENFILQIRLINVFKENHFLIYLFMIFFFKRKKLKNYFCFLFSIFLIFLYLINN